MDYRNFCEDVAEMVRNALGNEFKVDIKEVLKNNGVRLIGLDIGKIESYMSQIMYLEDLYVEYVSEDISISEVVDRIVENFTKNSEQIPVEVADIKEILKWNDIKEKVMSRLINTEMNEELLKDLPHREFMDLSVVYYLDVSANSTMLINNRHITHWDIDEEVLFNCANKNRVISNNKVFRKMNDIVAELLDIELDEEFEEKSPANDMFVLTNKKKLFGAIHMMDETVLEEIKHRIGNFVILPSSIHELIILPQIKYSNYEELAEMVRNINISELDATEILSNHIYLYRGRGIEMVA